MYWTVIALVYYYNNSRKPIYTLIDEFFFIGNQDKFLAKSSVHSINTRNKHHLHDLLLNCLVFKKAHPALGSEFLTTYHKALQALGVKNHSLK